MRTRPRSAIAGTVSPPEPSFNQKVPTAGRTDLNDTHVQITHSEHGRVIQEPPNYLTACRQTLSESVGYVAQRSLITNWTRVMQRYSEAGRRIYQPSVSITNIDWTKISTSQVAKDSSAQETQVQ